MSQVSKTKAILKNKIISAKADIESAKFDREVNDILDIKKAMQIIFLEILKLMEAMKSKKTIIIPMQINYD